MSEAIHGVTLAFWLMSELLLLFTLLNVLVDLVRGPKRLELAKDAAAISGAMTAVWLVERLIVLVLS